MTHFGFIRSSFVLFFLPDIRHLSPQLHTLRAQFHSVHSPKKKRKTIGNRKKTERTCLAAANLILASLTDVRAGWFGWIPDGCLFCVVCVLCVVVGKTVDYAAAVCQDLLHRAGRVENGFSITPPLLLTRGVAVVEVVMEYSLNLLNQLRDLARGGKVRCG